MQWSESGCLTIEHIWKPFSVGKDFGALMSWGYEDGAHFGELEITRFLANLERPKWVPPVWLKAPVGVFSLENFRISDRNIGIITFFPRKLFVS